MKVVFIDGGANRVSIFLLSYLSIPAIQVASSLLQSLAFTTAGGILVTPYQIYILYLLNFDTCQLWQWFRVCDKSRWLLLQLSCVFVAEISTYHYILPSSQPKFCVHTVLLIISIVLKGRAIFKQNVNAILASNKVSSVFTLVLAVTSIVASVIIANRKAIASRGKNCTVKRILGIIIQTSSVFSLSMVVVTVTSFMESRDISVIDYSASAYTRCIATVIAVSNDQNVSRTNNEEFAFWNYQGMAPTAMIAINARTGPRTQNGTGRSTSTRLSGLRFDGGPNTNGSNFDTESA